ncbi:hypothetical protein DICSQDRAFT_134315 [Dichomitus squalens LYAD-421 SS1]|uniref:uncharacterized protein n=1 Tax=Dichomitus squalens (strain LYAD-421) TaxID=732165 RepID=UPI000441250E|nr:uncharacterized protein DICSQDRAFT_134315 [Dichomitus squalens LYAD-421 SS1]EJF63710.1 hypothetical protein DICSQDRAFT_134315 [Dichomitus squalens LYAD-421 SS1]
MPPTSDGQLVSKSRAMVVQTRVDTTIEHACSIVYGPTRRSRTGPGKPIHHTAGNQLFSILEKAVRRGRVSSPFLAIIGQLFAPLQRLLPEEFPTTFGVAKTISAANIAFRPSRSGRVVYDNGDFLPILYVIGFPRPYINGGSALEGK